MKRHKKTEPQVMREMALVDWVKQAIFDAMKIWIDDHDDELAELIVKSLSERIEITFLPKFTIKAEEQEKEYKDDTEASGKPCIG